MTMQQAIWQAISSLAGILVVPVLIALVITSGISVTNPLFLAVVALMLLEAAAGKLSRSRKPQDPQPDA